MSLHRKSDEPKRGFVSRHWLALLITTCVVAVAGFWVNSFLLEEEEKVLQEKYYVAKKVVIRSSAVGVCEYLRLFYSLFTA